MIKISDDEMECMNCRFWSSDESGKWGECRRYPPQFWSEGDQSGSCHVRSNSKGWCGEFQPKEKLVVKEQFDMFSSLNEDKNG